MTDTIINTAPPALTGRALSTGWTVRAAGGKLPQPFAARLEAAIPAEVPGVVHLDLLRAGIIPDPYLDDNESLLAWIGLVDWTYETVFDLTALELVAHSRHDLVFDGLDTVATVLLNGATVAEVANQHRSYRIDVRRHLQVGANVLTVAFRSPVRAADTQSVVLGARPRPYPSPFNSIRKSACSFGWDWGISTTTSGVWRAVRLESWSGVRLAEARVVATPEGTGGRVDAAVRIERDDTDPFPASVSLDAAGVRADITIPAEADQGTLTVALDKVDLWWPTGHGAQPLYDVTVSLGEDVARRRVGFRTLHWNTAPDASGTPFELVVNDRPIYVKGVNWIPDDAFPSRIDRARYAQRLEQAKAANLNLIRVWGGGIYETDDFYDLCDELGLLTWQDFLFACAAYSEEEPLRGEVEAEARENVARIAHHASLALFTGNNENLWGYEDWNWKALLDGKTWGAYYYYELFPAVIGALAPQVPYAPGSPFSPGGQHPADELHGTTHLWEQWNRLDWATYRDHRPRFVAEFGWQGPPAWTTLTQALSDDPMTPDSPGMIVHQKAIDGNAKLATGLVAHYRIPDDMENWHWAMQLNQANAVGTALSWFRSLAPYNAGAVVWQLNDCWPVTSWAAIDGYGREKPLLHAIRNAFASRVVTIQPSDGALRVVVGNDTDASWAGQLTITRRSYDGLVLETQMAVVDASPRSSVTVPVDLAAPVDASCELIVAELGGARGEWFFTDPRDSALPAQQTAVVVVPAAEGFDVTVVADGLVRDLTLLIDRVAPDARVDSGLVTLLPGESHTFRVTGVEELAATDVARPEVLRSGNQLVTTA
ncbi:glycoside hydrolase family 2 protein [Microbacterium sp. ASV49]|uniref:beta-mannosidase n=1 Tax=Microbacterium candidum TaxID=3041922 RepID=A0ABT7MW91_9MICO|nr:glycoside hydrolase family 2 protein [Microbacterium sp. ASV49]MDL9978706.1 glycoside hydrolase family 2 protein [Microbacterium sp. ASV49]